jgi:type III secretory pathway component EscV
MKRLIKPLLLVSLSTLICVLLLLVFLVFNNNCCQKTIDVEALQQSHNASVQWLIQNEEKLITEHNPILWEMIAKTAELTQNSTLEDLFNRYQRQFFSFYRTHPFGFLLNGYNKANFLTADLSVFPYYNLFFYVWLYL